jgi:glyoxylate reductase
MHKVVMARKLLPLAQQRLEQSCEIIAWDKEEAMPREVLLDWIQDAEGLVAAPNITIDEELLARAPKLRVIAQPAVGYNNIDIDACTRRGIPVGYTPGVLVEATADLAFGLLLCATRRIHEGWDFVRQGQWQANRNIPLGIDLFGKTLGIVGMGQIGSAVARRARAFGLNVIYHNRTRRTDEQSLGTEYAGFEELLRQADFIIVLSSLTPETRGMFGARQFELMKPTVYFVNASRGAIVDTKALMDALSAGEIAYAALDVTDPEPLPGDHPLLKYSNILVTPHIGSATTETRNSMARLTADNLLAGLAGMPLPASVNEARIKESAV